MKGGGFLTAGALPDASGGPLSHSSPPFIWRSGAGADAMSARPYQEPDHGRMPANQSLATNVRVGNPSVD